MKKILPILLLLAVFLFAGDLLFSDLQGKWSTEHQIEDTNITFTQKIEFHQDSFFLAVTNVTKMQDSLPGSEFTNYVMGKVKIIDDNTFILKGVFVDSEFGYKLKKDHRIHYRRKFGKVKIVCHFTKRGDSFYLNEVTVADDDKKGGKVSKILTIGPFEKVVD